MKAILSYALAAALVVATGAWLLASWLGPVDAAAVRWSAAAAYVVQVAAFAALVGLRGRVAGFLLAWGGGTLLRFGVVVGVALWVARTGSHAPAPLLLSLAGFLLVLLLIEPIFFRMGMRTR